MEHPESGMILSLKVSCEDLQPESLKLESCLTRTLYELWTSMYGSWSNKKHYPPGNWTQLMFFEHGPFSSLIIMIIMFKHGFEKNGCSTSIHFPWWNVPRLKSRSVGCVSRRSRRVPQRSRGSRWSRSESPGRSPGPIVHRVDGSKRGSLKMLKGIPSSHHP